MLKIAIICENSGCTDEKFKATFLAEKVNFKSRSLYFTHFTWLTLLNYDISQVF